ncbi:mobilization protein [Streptacidiphilus sp. 4-A2]|nr:mobilization protein [Streptacidiphilus sp. 4-A2]
MIVKPIQVRDYAYKTVAYLFGPGRSNEHTNPHLVAAWNTHAPDPGRQPDQHTVGKLAARLDIPLKALRPEHRPEVKYLHIPLRAAPEDRHLTDTEWATAARRVLTAAGLLTEGDDQGCRWIAVRHADDHIHLLVTMIRPGTAAAPDLPGRYIKAMRREVDRIEADFGLRQLKPGDGTAAKLAGHREHFKARRQAQPAESIRLRTTVREALAASSTVTELVTHLAEHGVIADVRHKPSGDIRGITFAHQPADGDEPVWFSGSRLAPDLSLPKLLTRLKAAEHFTTGYQPGDPWRHAARALDQFPRVLAHADDQQAADHIHAVGTLLDAAAQTAPTTGRAELRQAAIAFERATRTRKEADHQAGHALRDLAYQLTRTTTSGGAAAWLLCAAIAAVVAIALAQARHHQQQAQAAQQTLTHLRAAYQHTAAEPLARLAAQTPDSHITSRWEKYIRTVLPRAADRITADPTWPALATTLQRTQTTTHKPPALASAEEDKRELTDADNPAALLLWRLHDQQAELQHRRTQAATRRASHHPSLNTTPQIPGATSQPRQATRLETRPKR